MAEFGEIREIRYRSSTGPRPCSFDGCVNQAAARGLCASHAKQMKDKGRLTPLAKRRPRSVASCAFEGCEMPVYGKDLCSGHYQQKYRYKLKVLRPIGDRLKSRGPCAYELCDRKASRGEYCSGHRSQVDRGAPLTPLKGTLPWVMWRFESLEAEGPHGCWLWESTNSRGYPSCNLKYQGRKFSLAHRLSYAIFNGVLLDGVAVHHTCGVKNCVNPAHLQTADHAENTLESLERKAHRARIAELENELRNLRKGIKEE